MLNDIANGNSLKSGGIFSNNTECLYTILYIDDVRDAIFKLAFMSLCWKIYLHHRHYTAATLSTVL